MQAKEENSNLANYIGKSMLVCKVIPSTTTTHDIGMPDLDAMPFGDNSTKAISQEAKKRNT
jgi:hypothetical protein